MTRRSVGSTRRQGGYAEQFADDFDAPLLHNKVWDDVDEDDQLARLCDAAEAADAAGDLRESYQGEDAELVEKIDEANGLLGWVARQRALEKVAEICAEVIEDGDEWTDAWSQSDVDDAKHEAREWLQTHTAEADRVGVLEVLS